MKDFRELQVWEKGHRLTLAVYRATKQFPSDERFGLTSQLRRAASSIPANIAEGCGRDGDAELCRFLQIACGSASEVHYHIILARDLEFISKEDFVNLEKAIQEVKRMLSSFIRRMKPLERTIRPK